MLIYPSVTIISARWSPSLTYISFDVTVHLLKRVKTASYPRYPLHCVAEARRNTRLPRSSVNIFNRVWEKRADSKNTALQRDREGENRLFSRTLPTLFWVLHMHLSHYTAAEEHQEHAGRLIHARSSALSAELLHEKDRYFPQNDWTAAHWLFCPLIWLVNRPQASADWGMLLCCSAWPLTYI